MYSRTTARTRCAARKNCSRSKGDGPGGAFKVLVAACITAEFFWWIVGIIAAGLILRLIIKSANAATDREIARALASGMG